MGAAVLGGQRGRASTQGICKRACACEPGECPVCAALVTFCLCQPRRRRGLGCLPLCLCESSMGLLSEAVPPLWLCE